MKTLQRAWAVHRILALCAGATAMTAACSEDPSSSDLADDVTEEVSVSPTGAAVTVDPPSPALTGVTHLGEWEAAGSFEGWTLQNATGGAVAGGSLTATGSGAGVPEVVRSGLSGPDLDLGWNDIIDVRLRVPSGLNGDVQVFFGTSAEHGFSSDRRLVIPAAKLVRDGSFHVYRINVGLVPHWRGRLHDIRIDVPAAKGASFAIDYVRAGDLAGDVYKPDVSTYPLNAPGVSEMSSKRFRVLWNQTSLAKGFDPSMAHDTLRNLEEVWQVHRNLLGMPDPGARDGQKLKINLTTWNDGYYESGYDMNIDPSGLQTNPPTWVIPHELGHVFQAGMAARGSHMAGMWWEGHANYVRERWIYWYSFLFPGASNLDSYYTATANWHLGDGRNYYLSWPFFLYLDENPDKMAGLGPGTNAKLWLNNRDGESIYDTLARIAPSAARKDIIGNFARREVVWDYTHRAELTAAAQAGDTEFLDRGVYANLVQRGDDPSWWQVPPEMAPMQGSYTITRLVPTAGAARTVSVELHGLPWAARGADWRASLVVVADSGAVRYSPLFNSGSQAVTLAANENRVYLVVAATPDSMPFLSQDDMAYPYQSTPAKTRFLYEVKIAGATPSELRGAPRGAGAPHPNGGGFVASTAVVDAAAYVGPNAMVLDSARVHGNARIEDFAVVEGQAQVLDSAIVSGHALVRDNAIVKGQAKVRDFAMVQDTGVVAERGRVLQRARVMGGTVAGDATAKGKAEVWAGSASLVSGDAVVDGNYGAQLTVKNGFQFGFIPYVGTTPESIAARKAPAHLFAAYEFTRPHDALALDKYGTTDAYLIGSPSVTSGALNLNGSSQYVVLDRSVADFKDTTLAAWINPAQLTAGAPLFFFGADASRFMELSIADAAGHLRFVAHDGAVEQSLVSTAAVRVGSWAHVAVTLSGTTAVIYVNGTAAGTAEVSIDPDELLAPNTSAPEHAFLGRDLGTRRFSGALDDVYIYSAGLSGADIRALAANRL